MFAILKSGLGFRAIGSMAEVGDDETYSETQPSLDSFVSPPTLTVSIGQAKKALLFAGLLPKVEDALAILPGVEGEAARIDWNCEPMVRRDASLVKQLAGALGLTDEALDKLFEQAAKL